MNTHLSTADHIDTVRTPPPSRRVLDAPTRLLHWLMAFSFVGAYLTADGERWRLVHITLGYTLAGVLVARVLWGLWGPRQARLSGLWRRVRGLPAWLGEALRGQVEVRQGLNLTLAATVVGLLGLIVPLTLSGLGVDQEWLRGDALEEVHEFLGNTMLWLVLVHLGMLLTLSLQRRRNLVTPMVTGRAPGAGPDVAKHRHGAVAALLLATVLAFWAWQWQTAPAPDAEGAVSAGAQSRHDDHDD